MKGSTRFLLIVALVATAATSLQVPSQAQKGDFASPTQMQATAVGGPTEERWWGGLAAIGCGFGIRYGSAFGGAGAVATVALCLIALVDAVT